MASRVVSFHQKYALLLIIMIASKVNKLNVVLKLTLTISVVAHASLALIIGHGLRVTI